MKRLAIILVTVILIAIGSLALLTVRPASPRIRIAGTTLTVELASTPAERDRGLSGRSFLSPDQGMLFVFSREGYYSFWMRDMMFPLDIIWFDASRRAVFIVENLQPCTPQNCPISTPSHMAMYVLEVNAGFVLAHAVTLGTSFEFEPEFLPF